MPIFSSDSEGDVAPIGRLFGRERSVHALLGGGKVADVLLWRDKRISAALLIGIGVIWFLLEVVEYNLVTLLCHIFITTMLIIFIWSTGAYILRWAPPEIPRIILQDSNFKDLKLLSELLYIACGNDQKLFFMAILSLWLVSRIGYYISTLNLLFLGLLCMETLPFLYERYEEEVDYLVGKVNRNMRKIYKKFDSNVLGKIPKGQALASFSRLLHREIQGEGSEKTIKELKTKLAEAEEEKTKHSLQLQEANKKDEELEQYNNALRIQLSDHTKIENQLTEERDKLLNQNKELQQQLEQQSKQQEQDLEKLTDELQKNQSIIKTAAELEKENKTLKDKIKGSEEAIKEFKAKLTEAEEEKTKLNHQLQEANKKDEELKKYNNALRIQLFDHAKIENQLTEKRDKLLDQNKELQQQLEQRSKQSKQQEQDLEKLTDELQKKRENIQSIIKTVTKLEKENKTLKDKDKTITPEQRQQIISEYRTSNELRENIKAEYDKGYQAAKSKLREADVDPTIFGFSEDDEFEDEYSDEYSDE